MNSFETLLRKHHELDFAIRDRKGRVFYSDWDCVHPMIDTYLDDINESISESKELHLYKFYEDCNEISEKISAFHRKEEQLDYDNTNLLAGDGSTPLISSFCIWLYQNNITEVFYVPPLYYTFYYFGKIFGITLRPVSNRHPFEEGFQLKLPMKQCTLILTDPIWYAGISLQPSLIETIAKWQQKTGSFIFIDGSFQYSRWKGLHKELTATFDPEKTVRLICPTKALAIHGFRFSYLLLPGRIRDDIRYIFANTHGATTAHNLLFAIKSMDILLSKKSNFDLMKYICDRYQFLLDEGWIESELIPDSGYFIFGKPTKKALRYPQILMDGDFFEQTRYHDYIRFNLLAPDMQQYVYNSNN